MNKIFTIFDKYQEVLVAFSTKQDGSMRLTSMGDESIDKENSENRKNFLSHLNILATASPVLEHGANIAKVQSLDPDKPVLYVDGLITNQPNVFLGLTTADCLPIFYYDPDKKVIALVHAGWRGLLKGIIENTVSKFKEEYNSNVANIIVGIGPCICYKHYEVQKDLIQKFVQYPESIIRKGEKNYLDLRSIALTKLLQLGLQAQNIEISNECTFELQDKYFSYRRDKPSYVSPMFSVLGLTEQ